MTLGSTVVIVATIYWNDGGYCSGCITQLYIGITGFDGKSSCSGNFGNSFVGYKTLTYTTTITTTGCLTLYRTYSYQFSCISVTSGTIIAEMYSVQGNRYLPCDT